MRNTLMAIALAIATTAMATAAVRTQSKPAAKPAAKAPAAPPVSVGCPANAKPANLNFTLKDINGKSVKLSDYKGKVILMNFWATWCGPCKTEIPGFIELRSKYQAQGFEVLGVLLLDKFSNAPAYVKQMKMDYPILNGDEQQDAIDNAYGPLFGLPMSFIIGRDGRLCQTHIGLPGAPEKGNGPEPDAKTV